ncbi:hypothetical protein [Streptococcus pneumoniae]|uniref:hypothetical protein n=1 Tax=Streptococcus pneumoniae TaxID=1313 RepID=UPI001E3CECCD|nr:hypothetical protein [Streptococcus pneumoniae]
MLEIDLTVLIDLSCSYFILLYSFEMVLAAGCSKHCFKVVDGTDADSSKHCFEVVDKAKLMWFEEVFEECKKILVS